LKVKRCVIPARVVACLESLNDQWDTSLRYVGTFIPRREAEQFMRSVRIVHEWVKETL
jgi:hypothetical protein